MDCYIFSGLGADDRVFQRLDFSGYSITFIEWLTPIENETIEKYASRLLIQIKTTRPILMGLSFGGLIAIEVAKQIEVQKVILLASVKIRREIPFYFRIAGLLMLHKPIPVWALKKSNVITNWIFGAESEFDKQLLKQILMDTDPKLLKWAIDNIVNWKNKIKINNIFHIHGSNDRLLPIMFVKCDHVVKNGGHLMTLNNSVELSKILRQHLQVH